jgi:hypothetical protein
MKKILTFIIVILSIAIIMGKNMLTAQENSVSSKSESHCSIADGVQFCVSVSVVFDKSDNGRVILKTSLKNITENSIKLDLLSGFYNRYKITIRDDLGNIVQSEQEIAQKAAENKESDNGEITSIPTSSGRYNLIQKLVPQEEFRVEYDLCNYYKFSPERKYLIEIGRNLKVGENSLSEIKIAPIAFDLNKNQKK